MANIGSLVVSLQARTESLEKQLNRANGLIRKLQGETKGIGTASRRAEQTSVRAFRRMSAGASGLSSRILTASRSMRAFAAAAGLFIAGRFITQAIASADQIGKFADRLGIGVEAFQELSFAATQSGVSMEQFRTALQRIVRQAQDAVEGNTRLEQAFRELGVSMEDLRTLRPDQIFERVAVASAEVENGLAKLRVVAESEGVVIRQMGVQGADGLRRMRNEARALGGVLSDDLVRRAASANDAIGRMALVLRVNLTEAALTVAPLIVKIGKGLSDIVKAVNLGKEAFQNLSGAQASLAKFFSSLRDLFKEILPLAAKLLRLIEPALTFAMKAMTFVLNRMNAGMDKLNTLFGENTEKVEKNTRAYDANLAVRGRVRFPGESELPIVAQRRQFPSPDLKDRVQETTRAFRDYERQLRAVANAPFINTVNTVFDSLTESIASAATGVALGTQSIADAIRNMVNSIAASLLSSGINQALGVLQRLAVSALGAGVGAGAGAGSSGGFAPVQLPLARGTGFSPNATAVTVINVADQQQAQRIAALETAQGRSVTVTGLAQQVRAEGNGNPLVQSLRDTLRP